MELIRRYELETALYRLDRKSKEAAESWKQAKYDSRTRWEEVQLYKGSLRSLLDRFSGKQAEKAEALHRELRHAEETLAALTQERENLSRSREQILAELTSLPSLDALRDLAAKDPNTKKKWALLEAALCAEQLLPLLAENEAALLEYRRTMQGNRVGEVLTYEQLHEYGTAPNDWAEKCQPLLRRLKAAMEVLGELLEIGSYFENPVGYIVSAASKYNRFDRLNQAMDQVTRTRKQISGILERYAE